MPKTRRSSEDHLVAPTNTYHNARTIENAGFLVQGSPQNLDNSKINLTQINPIPSSLDFCMEGQLKWGSQNDSPQDTSYTRQEQEDNTLTEFGF